MFRRNGKGPLEKKKDLPGSGSSLYREDPIMTTPYASRHGAMQPPLFTQGVRHEEYEKSMKTTPLPHPLETMLKEEQPETTLGEGVVFRGELMFERLLRIDGTFEGQLLSQGKVIVGPKGKVKADLNLREAVIEGEVVGNITVTERLELRGEATVHGDIEAKSLCVDEGVTLVGAVKVIPQSGASSMGVG